MSEERAPTPKAVPTLAPKPDVTDENTTSEKEDVFPFLVHSQDSITNGEPPEVDNAKLARQKRKRTR